MSGFQLSTQSAQRIVAEIGGIVGQNINMMDAQGYIIASTDPARIGFLHEGARQIIEERLPELYIGAEEATATARTGLNLPITHRGDIVGVIGITGEYGQVIGYGQVVKKMTEILIRESTEQDDKRLDLRMRSRFLENWVLAGGPVQGQALAERGLALGIDITIPRRVMVISAQELEHYTDNMAGQKLIENVENAVAAIVEAENGNIILRNAARQILLVRQRTDEQMRALALRLCKMARQTFGVYLCAGIDGEAGDVHKAYAQANTAWRSARMTRSGVMKYDQVTLELVADEVSRQTKMEFIRKVFRGCGYEEVRRWMGILEAYYESEGSISAAAQALYMHKNTLQYKLKKLCDITGRDVRLPSDSPVFYMAMLFFKEVEGSLLLLDD